MQNKFLYFLADEQYSTRGQAEKKEEEEDSFVLKIKIDEHVMVRLTVIAIRGREDECAHSARETGMFFFIYLFKMNTLRVHALF